MSEAPIKKNLDGKPDSHKIELGKPCLQPLRDQLFPQEWDSLQEFKKRVADLAQHYEDEFLMACLFARKMDHERAEALLKNNWKWRCENNLKTLPGINDIDWSFLSAQCSVPGSRTKNGHFIMYSNVKNFDPSKIDMDKLLIWAAWFYLRGAHWAGMDVPRNGIIMVQDMDGFGWKHFDLKFQKRFSAIFQENFPMRLKKSMILNPPTILKLIVGLVRPFMSKKLMDRMSVASLDELLDFAGKENVWSEFGGTLEGKRADFVSAIAEYADWRYGDKLTKPVMVNGVEYPINYKILKRDEDNKGKVISSDSANADEKKEKK